jgi:hypothetical protein
MSELESTRPRRFVWPAEYYSGPSPVAVLPRGVTFGCGAAAVVALLLLFAGGAFMASGGIVDFMDLALGMSMSELRGMYTTDVTAAQKKEVDDTIEQVRAGLRNKKVSITQLQPLMETMRKAIADQKVTSAEARSLVAAARKTLDGV